MLITFLALRPPGGRGCDVGFSPHFGGSFFRAPYQLIQRHAKQPTHFHQLIQLGNRPVGLPFRDRLAGYVQLLRQISLGQVPPGAQGVDGLSKTQVSFLLFCAQ